MKKGTPSLLQYVIFVIIAALMLFAFRTKSATFQIITLIAFVVFQLLITYKYGFQPFGYFYMILSVLMVGMTIAFVALKTNETVTAAVAVITTVVMGVLITYGVVGLILIRFTRNIWNGEEVIESSRQQYLVVNYACIVIFSILIWGASYPLLNSWEGHAILRADGSNVTKSELFYFSAASFYSAPAYNLEAHGFSGGLALAETIFGYVLHAVVIAFALGKLPTKKSDSGQMKGIGDPCINE